MSIGPICEVTILTCDLTHSLEMYAKAFNWTIEPQESTHIQTASRWLPEELKTSHQRRVGGPGGSVRFIETKSIDPMRPLTTHGWTALEICVDDVYAYTEQAVNAGFTMLNEPVKLEGSKNPLPLIAAQIAGINGEVVYVTQILDEVPNFELPDVSEESGSIFICVLGASNLEESRQNLEQSFDLKRVSDRSVAIKVINKVFELPIANLHRISSLQLLGRNAIEIDQMPPGAVPRKVQLGSLVPGISIVSVKANISKPEMFELPDNALLELIPQDV